MHKLKPIETRLKQSLRFPSAEAMVKRNRNPYEDFMAKNPAIFPWGSDDEIQAQSHEPPDLGTAALSISPLQQNIAEGSISWALPSSRLLAGKVLQHCQAVIKRFRLESGGFELVIYKIGITHECSTRFELYQAKGWDQMVVMYQSDELGAVEMLEAALISHHSQLQQCRNVLQGGEGMRDKMFQAKFNPPYFCYCVLARADRARWVL